MNGLAPPTNGFEQQLSAAWTPSSWSDMTVLVAVSGGADSVALLRGLTRIRRVGKGRLVVGHFNHQLRGKAALADEQFVRGLCDQLKIACHVGRASEDLFQAEAGIEVRAREQRYRFLHQLSDQLGARYLVTAHTADDQVETVLHRFLRGTGLRGLAGIPAIRVLSGLTTVVRPMLAIDRDTVRSYLDQLGQPFRHDASNDELIFTRNRIRHELLPELKKHFNPQVADAIARLANLAGEAQDVIDQLVGPLLDHSMCTDASGQVRLDCQTLFNTPALIVRELLILIWKRQGWPLREMGHDQWCQLSDLVSADSADTIGEMMPGGIQVWRQDSILHLRRTE
jgi:tRNA(Ile)-lysidine synthase